MELIFWEDLNQQKAIRDRGWFPPDCRLLTNPEIVRTKHEQAPATPSPSSTSVPLFISTRSTIELSMVSVYPRLDKNWQMVSACRCLIALYRVVTCLDVVVIALSPLCLL